MSIPTKRRICTLDNPSGLEESDRRSIKSLPDLRNKSPRLIIPSEEKRFKSEQELGYQDFLRFFSKEHIALIENHPLTHQHGIIYLGMSRFDGIYLTILRQPKTQPAKLFYFLSPEYVAIEKRNAYEHQQATAQELTKLEQDMNQSNFGERINAGVTCGLGLASAVGAVLSVPPSVVSGGLASPLTAALSLSAAINGAACVMSVMPLFKKTRHLSQTSSFKKIDLLVNVASLSVGLPRIFFRGIWSKVYHAHGVKYGAKLRSFQRRNMSISMIEESSKSRGINLSRKQAKNIYNNKKLKLSANQFAKGHLGDRIDHYSNILGIVDSSKNVYSSDFDKTIGLEEFSKKMQNSLWQSLQELELFYRSALSHRVRTRT